jgi:hypothetical protein
LQSDQFMTASRRAIIGAALAAAAMLSCSDPQPGNQGGGNGETASDAGAGDDGGGPVDESMRCVPRAGSRLQTVFLYNGGDQGDLVRYADSEFAGATCTFRTAADGALRCLPVATSDAVFSGASRVWTDAGCTSEIAEVAYEGTPTSFVVYEFPSLAACAVADTTTRFHEAGARLPYDGTQTVYEKDGSGTCVARTAYFNRSYYTLGAEILPERFVAAEETYSTGGRLAVHSAEGEDGSRFCDDSTLRDETRGEVCTVQLSEDGTYRCLPAISLQATFYSDAACSSGATAAAAQLHACGKRNPRYIQGPVAACSPGRAIYQRGALASGPFFYLAAACTPLEAGYDLYPVGDHVAPEELVGFAEEHIDVGGRLQRIDLVGGGARIHQNLWYDPELDSACWFRRTEENTMRCVPLSRAGAPIAGRGSMRTGYSDPACTVAVQAVAEDCSGARPRYLVDTGDSSRVYPVGAKLQGLYYSAGSCTAMPGTWYQLGAAMPFAELVPGFETRP